MSGFRYRRRVRLAPGISMNLSKSGPSLSFGGRGFHYTVGHHRRRTTVGLPGTGLSYTTYSHAHARQASGQATRHQSSAATLPAAPPASSTSQASPPLLPAQKITVGIILTVLILTSPIGIPMIIVGLVQRNQPLWRMRTLVHRATRMHTPAEALTLLEQANALMPDNPEAIAPLAEWHYDQEDWATAADLYARYCSLAPDDRIAIAHLANACLEAGRVEEAISAFQRLRSDTPEGTDSHASITSHLAQAFLEKGDVQQASELVKAEPLQRHALSAPLQECLFLRGVTQYLLGQRARGIGDIDRLYALNAEFAGVATTKQAMEAGTFAWPVRNGPPLVPQGRSRAAAHATAATASQQAVVADAPPSGLLSPDGAYSWDGRVWQPVSGGRAGGR